VGDEVEKLAELPVRREGPARHEEALHLDKGRALVLLGQENPIEDVKSYFWRHKHYDRRYMAKKPERSFDYAAWKDAGRPTGETLERWEKVHVKSVVPAKGKLDAAQRTYDATSAELEDKRLTGVSGERLVKLQRAQALAQLELDAARAHHDLAQAIALEAAGKRLGHAAEEAAVRAADAAVRCARE